MVCVGHPLRGANGGKSERERSGSGQSWATQLKRVGRATRSEHWRAKQSRARQRSVARPRQSLLEFEKVWAAILAGSPWSGETERASGRVGGCPGSVAARRQLHARSQLDHQVTRRPPVQARAPARRAPRAHSPPCTVACTSRTPSSQGPPSARDTLAARTLAPQLQPDALTRD